MCIPKTCSLLVNLAILSSVLQTLPVSLNCLLSKTKMTGTCSNRHLYYFPFVFDLIWIPGFQYSEDKQKDNHHENIRWTLPCVAPSSHQISIFGASAAQRLEQSSANLKVAVWWMFFCFMRTNIETRIDKQDEASLHDMRKPTWMQSNYILPNWVSTPYEIYLWIWPRMKILKSGSHGHHQSLTFLPGKVFPDLNSCPFSYYLFFSAFSCVFGTWKATDTATEEYVICWPSLSICTIKYRPFGWMWAGDISVGYEVNNVILGQKVEVQEKFAILWLLIPWQNISRKLIFLK